MNNNSVKLYFKQIHDIKPLSVKEEAELFLRSKGDDDEAKKARLRLIEVNLPLVITLAKKYFYPALGIEFLNFIEEGNIGLVKAVERFDPEKGFRFSTYASWWVEKHFQEAILMSRSVIQLPEKKLRNLKKIENTASKLLQESGSYPDYSKVAEKIDMSITEIRNTLLSVMKMKYVKSLDFYLDSDKTNMLKDIIADEENSAEQVIEDISIRQEINALMDSLSVEEKQIVSLRFGLGGICNHTYAEIAEKLGISESRTKDVYNMSIRKLRRCIKDSRSKG